MRLKIPEYLAETISGVTALYLHVVNFPQYMQTNKKLFFFFCAMLVEVILRSLLLFGQCAYGEMQSANHQKLTSEPIELEPVTGDPAVPPPSKTDIPSDDGSGKKGCLLL